nr:CNNM domain-containing protein [Halalkalibacterium ligniniphilum]
MIHLVQHTFEFSTRAYHLTDLVSVVFSSDETAYSSVNKLRLKSYTDENRPGGVKAFFILQHFEQALSTNLIGNNLVNIAAATISAQVATALFGGNTGLLISTMVMAILILVFGEVLPIIILIINMTSIFSPYLFDIVRVSLF